MKVYLLSEDRYQPFVHSVYSTREKAEAFMEAKPTRADFNGRPQLVEWAGIEEYEVDAGDEHV